MIVDSRGDRGWFGHFLLPDNLFLINFLAKNTLELTTLAESTYSWLQFRLTILFIKQNVKLWLHKCHYIFLSEAPCPGIVRTGKPIGVVYRISFTSALFTISIISPDTYL